MNNKLTEQEKKNIWIQEVKDRYITTNILYDINNGEDLNINPTSVLDNVDLRCSVINGLGNYVSFTVEIKERIKNNSTLERFPFAELKTDKYERMIKSTPKGQQILYCVLLNEKTCYLFNLNKIDFNKINITKWKIKKTQLDEDSEYLEYNVYQIPYNMAFKVVDCKKYFNDYNNNKESIQNNYKKMNI